MKNVLKEFIELTLNESIVPRLRNKKSDIDHGQAMNSLVQQYSKAYMLISSQFSGTALSGKVLKMAKSPQLHLEKAVAYYVNEREGGADISVDLLGRKLAKLRNNLAKKGFNGDSPILQAFQEDESAVADAMDELGWFGSSSDELRDPADQMY